MVSIKQALKDALPLVQAVSTTPSLDAEVLLGNILHLSRAQLYVYSDKQIDNPQYQEFLSLINERSRGIPVAYLVGHQEFWSLKFSVNKSVLIPRPETELLVEVVLDRYGNNKSYRVLDAGTGSGAIAVSLGFERANWTIYAVERSLSALGLAKNNAASHHTVNVNFVCADWLTCFQECSLDIIVANPPYIADTDAHLQGSIRFEPQSALVAKDNGMSDITKIVAQANTVLVPGGLLIIEHGYNQASMVARLLREHAFTRIACLHDLAGLERATLGYLHG